MSNSAKRRDVNRTATRRGAAESAPDADLDSAADRAEPEATDRTAPEVTDGAEPEATGTPVVDGETVGDDAAASGDEDGKQAGSSPLSRRSRKEKNKDKPEKPLTERQRRREAKKALQLGNPRWFVPLMLAFFVLGLLWIVVFYLTQMAYPIPNINYWNLVIGFGLLMVGFGMTTRWK